MFLFDGSSDFFDKVSPTRNIINFFDWIDLRGFGDFDSPAEQLLKLVRG